ncbi:hypothetical protein EZV62_005816 [Acer yangbiense]|uniref:DNA mismatch repair protein MSH3 n=1 Tax=Acer yangbiense TaxID=1000413 RepID=A0A5C7INN3_9ROSI|nr:hypothetical protein EZV62_005816 [Acer yangbiense]
MGKQKQQVISRFFAPKPKTTSSSSSPPPPPPSPPPPLPSPKISATVAFSTQKRKVVSNHFPPNPKKPKPSSLLSNLREPSPPNLPEPSTKNYTPLEQQVVDLKKKHPDVLLMIEVGYRFRFFGDDAETAARVLGIYAHVNHNFATASVPTFRLNVHVRRLVSAGYKVGVVKQTETAAIKAHGPGRIGPFGRGLSALYTKATLEAAEDVGGGEEGFGGESNYLVCVVDSDSSDKSSCSSSSDDNGGRFDVRIGVVAVEISTGDVVFGEFNDGFMRSGLEAVVLSLSPAELLLGQPLSKQTEKFLLSFAGPASNVRVESASRDCFKDGGALAEVMSLFESMGEENLSNNEKQSAEVTDHQSAIQAIIDMPDLAVQALALTVCHLKQFGFEKIVCLGASFRSLASKVEMTLSANALQQLEVLRNNSNGSESGSLLHTMNHTLTIYGSRLLRHWVTHPLCDRNMISARLEAVSEIAESMGSHKTSGNVGGVDEENSDVTIVEPEFCHIISSVLTSLGRLPDIQRGITRIFHRTATPSEFIAVIQAILYAGKQLQRLCIEEEYNEKVPSKAVHSILLRKIILTAASATVVGKAAKFLSALNKESADQGDLPNLLIVSNGQFPEVAKARKAVQVAQEELDSLISLYRKQLGKRNLEFMSVSGTTHLIELPVDFKVPFNWVKVNSTKKMIRYHPPEVLTALDQLALASEELAIVCRAAWDSFLRGFGEHYAEFQAAVQALASLDCLHSLAILSRNKNYVRPVFVSDSEPVQIHICSGRHPVLDTMLQDNFVPNNTNLHADREYCQIVTGPNMGGKSCYIRQVALIAIMAQVGSFVPASSAELHVLDGIYTRMGASDSIQQGRSTFLEELSEASHILHNCTARSLVIIDELGRGTSTHDGVAIAYATLHHLLEHKKCMVLFVTHYPKIADIKSEFPGSVGAYHVSYLTSHSVTGAVDSKSDHEDVTYLYRLVSGVSERSFGFKVAQLAQLPSSCISRATVMATRLEAEVSNRVGNRSGRKKLRETIGDQEDLRENTLASHESIYAGMVEGPEELCSAAYGDFFRNLKFAILDDDPAKSFQYLKHARSIAKELIVR